MMNEIPFCPVMSAGSDIPLVCTQEKCAWYLKNCKSCAMYVLAYNATFDIKKKQTNVQEIIDDCV